MTVPDDTPSTLQLVTGRHGIYQWLATTEHGIDQLLSVAPAVVLEKHLAVTSHDSGPPRVTDEQKLSGWIDRGRITYSPRIESLDMVPVCIYDEWYVLKAPADLGATREGENISDIPVSPGHLEVFVNYYAFVPYGFVMDEPEMQANVSRFWQQMEWILPEAYIAESDYGSLTFVTRDDDLFAAARRGLAGLPPCVLPWSLPSDS